ncbi:L-mandelate dehydrogenase [Pseudohyphozyma bogoriensis]|nr:L-mandelate dehydrogenase [Pseudohyphozyma bogoriensis]
MLNLVTAFLASHPGGEAVILKHAGGDVSTVFNPIHPPQTMQMNTDVGVKKIGVVDLKALKLASNSALETESEELKAIHCPRGAIWCIADFEMRGLGGPREAAAGGAGAWGQGDGAKTVLGKKAKAYYEAAADDWISYYDAFASYQRCRLRPRVLVDVAEIDPRTTILGSSSTLPIYVSPAAWARMGHPLGEVNITRGVAKTGITQGISATASLSVVDICAEKKALEEKGSAPVNLAYQIYVNVNHEKTKKVMQQAIEGGVNAFFVTVDSAAFGNRETDFRSQGLPGSMDDKPHTKPNVENFGGLDASLNWEDIVWLKEAAQGRPLWIKGVACVEDVELARQHGVAGVVLSNHGGRQLDHAIAPIDTLIEINERDPTLLRDLEVYIDGGVRRGTDVLKALCLGAKGVGLGRPFLFAQSAYGEDGVVRTIRILEEEIVTGMRLLGARTLKDLKPEMVQCLTGQHKTPGSDK